MLCCAYAGAQGAGGACLVPDIRDHPLALAAIKRRQGLSQNGRQVLQRYIVAVVERYAEMAVTGGIGVRQNVRHVYTAPTGHYRSRGVFRPVPLFVCGQKASWRRTPPDPVTYCVGNDGSVGEACMWVFVSSSAGVIRHGFFSRAHAVARTPHGGGDEVRVEQFAGRSVGIRLDWI